MRQIIGLPLPGDAPPPRQRQAAAEQLTIPFQREAREAAPEVSPSQPPRYNRDPPREARLRMIGLVTMSRDSLDPVHAADQKTSMDDARIALSIASGIPLDDIDASSGHPLTRQAYQAVRSSWREKVQGHGWSEYYDRPRYEEAFAYWAERRPEFTFGDDWVADLIPTDPEPKGEEQ